jgi:hypothetical protein
MTAQTLGGIFLIVFGLANALFAAKIINYFVRTDSKRIIPMQFDLYPWLAPSMLWLIRVWGIFCVFGGFMLIINGFNP